jgi:plexin A
MRRSVVFFVWIMTFYISGLMLSPLVRERYPINYIYGFSSEGFSYFLTTQMKQTSPSPYESKIVRVCHDDSDYYSYTEVQI